MVLLWRECATAFIHVVEYRYGTWRVRLRVRVRVRLRLRVRVRARLRVRLRLRRLSSWYLVGVLPG